MSIATLGPNGYEVTPPLPSVARLAYNADGSVAGLVDVDGIFAATPDAFSKSTESAYSVIPMFDAGEVVRINGVKLTKIANAVGAIRYKIPDGTVLRSQYFGTAYDSSTANVKLSEVEIPAGALMNGDIATLTYKFNAPLTFGTAATLSMQFNSASDKLTRTTAAIGTSTTTGTSVSLTSADTNMLTISDSGAGLNFSAGNGLRDLNLLAPLKISLYAQFTTADNVGRYITATASLAFANSTPCPVIGADYVDARNRPFDMLSFWNTPISSTAKLQTSADVETAAFINTGNGIVRWAGESLTVWQASSNDELQTWTYSGRGSPTGYWPFSDTSGTTRMRTPANITAAASGNDNNIALFSPCGRYYIEGYSYSYNATTKEHHVSLMTVHDLYGYGWPSIWNRGAVWTAGFSTGIRAAGGPLLGGLVRGWEVSALAINHAVIMILPRMLQKAIPAVSIIQTGGTQVTVSAGGTGYKTGEVLTFVGGTGRAAEATITGINATTGAVTSLWLTNTGSYSVSPGTSAVATTGGSGTGCTLNCSTTNTSTQGSRIWPATNVDGGSGAYTGVIPLGALFTIPPSVDVTTLGLTTPEAVAFARAIQRYGAYNMDTAPDPTNNLLLVANDVTTAQQDAITGRVSGTMPNLAIIAAQMVMVRNNTPQFPGGFGVPIVAPTAGPYPLY